MAEPDEPGMGEGIGEHAQLPDIINHGRGFVLDECRDEGVLSMFKYERHRTAPPEKASVPGSASPRLSKCRRVRRWARM